ncbi:hypothetical protein EDD22DRAFT_922890 [Suillus occidentalis]|nr:hypothetical protein EDD22DRAFT_922890 [Suillus occidentalis]
MTLITISLHSSYLVFVYVFVFCRLECLHHMYIYHSTHFQPRLLLEYLDNTSPVILFFKLQAFRSVCTMESTPMGNIIGSFNYSCHTHPSKLVTFHQSCLHPLRQSANEERA